MTWRRGESGVLLFCRTIFLMCILAAVGCGTADPMRDTDTVPLYTKMTPDDVRTANQVVQNALEGTLSGTVLSWKNPISGHSGSVTPIKTFRSKSGSYCREYDETLTIGNRTERYTDTACRGADGRWNPVVVK